MKVRYEFNLRDKAVTLEEECVNLRDVFKWLARVEELFGDLECTRNGQVSDKVYPRVRVVDDNEYYEFVCIDPENPECNYAVRKFGITKKDGSLFPKRSMSGKTWVRYNRDTGKEE